MNQILPCEEFFRALHSSADHEEDLRSWVHRREKPGGRKCLPGCGRCRALQGSSAGVPFVARRKPLPPPGSKKEEAPMANGSVLELFEEPEGPYGVYAHEYDPTPALRTPHRWERLAGVETLEEARARADASPTHAVVLLGGPQVYTNGKPARVTPHTGV